MVASAASVDFTDIAGLNWSLVEEKIYFTIITLVCSGLNKKCMPINFQLKSSNRKRNI